MSLQRAPAVAGTFYPDDPQLLRGIIDDLLADRAPSAQPRRVLVVPHAGYRYSAAVAALAYAELRASWAQAVERVLLLGPAHRVAVPGLAAPDCEAFVTPLGAMPLDTGLLARLQADGLVLRSAAAHAAEHCLEVQVPFLQVLLPQARLVPLLVGRCPPRAVTELLRRLGEDPATLIVISTDLSHYQTAAQAERLDGETIAAIEAGAGGQLRGDAACGATVLRGLLAWQSCPPLRSLGYRHSGAVTGSDDAVVGYVACVG
ncbi:MAG: AmmeMemoRadiSam system protein B [Planctomycetota bacterium]